MCSLFSQIEESTCSLKYYNSETKDVMLGLLPLKGGLVFDPLQEAAKVLPSMNPLEMEKIVDASAPTKCS